MMENDNAHSYRKVKDGARTNQWGDCYFTGRQPFAGYTLFWPHAFVWRAPVQIRRKSHGPVLD
jgi:hypothetical protein